MTTRDQRGLEAAGRGDRSCGNDLVLAAAGAIAAWLAIGVDACPPTYRAHVYPPLVGYDSAMPFAIDSAGGIVGYAALKPFNPDSLAVRTQGAVLVPLDAPLESFNQAIGVNDLGVVVGISGLAATRWVGGTGTLLTPAPFHFSGAAWDVSGGGAICGTMTNDLIGFDFPVWWPTPTSEAQELPGYLGSGVGAAFAINDLKQMAGASGGGGGFVAVRWDDATKEPALIGTLPGAMNGELRAINALGDTAGRSSFPDFSTHAMLHIVATNDLIDLGVLGGSYSEARGINDAQQVVGFSSTKDFGHGFLWQDGAMHDLDTLVVTSNEPFLYVSGAVGINGAGEIAAEVVVGANPDGPRRIARLVPCAAGDIDCDGTVGFADLTMLLLAWGTCSGPACPATCPGDLDGTGDVGFADLTILLLGWG